MLGDQFSHRPTEAAGEVMLLGRYNTPGFRRRREHRTVRVAARRSFRLRCRVHVRHGVHAAQCRGAASARRVAQGRVPVQVRVPPHAVQRGRAGQAGGQVCTGGGLA